VRGASNGGLQGCEEIKVQVCNFISNTSCSTSPLTNNTCLQNDSCDILQYCVPVVLSLAPPKKLIFAPPLLLCTERTRVATRFFFFDLQHVDARTNERTTTTTKTQKQKINNHNFIHQSSIGKSQQKSLSSTVQSLIGPVLYCITLPFHTVGITVLYASNN
jgi:hypothetical protein